MKTTTTARTMVLPVVGVFLCSLLWATTAAGDDQDRLQDRLCTCSEDCLRTCCADCLCVCCPDCPCGCSLNCLCTCNEQCLCARCENRSRFTLRVMAGHTEMTGNCLSWPVIWADGVAKSLRGEEVPVFDGESFTFLHEEDPYEEEHPYHENPWFLQQDPLNEWQAQSKDWSATETGHLVVHLIDWGDNLEAKDWTTHSIVRVETVFYRNLPMNGYAMAHLWGLGMDEMWGTNGAIETAQAPTVYSHVVHLTIQKLSAPPENLVWNPTEYKWTGDAVGDYARTGPYSAEINVKGKVIYGYNWNIRKLGDGEGQYRITVSFEPESKVKFKAGETSIATSEESAEAEGEEPGGGGTAMIDFSNNLTFIDINVVPANGKGGGDGGGGDTGGGGTGGGGTGGGTGGGVTDSGAGSGTDTSHRSKRP